MCTLLINAKAIFVHAGVSVLIILSLLALKLRLMHMGNFISNFSKDRDLFSARFSSLSRWKPYAKFF